MRPSPVSGTTPPVETRWKPGESGNPTGRPKSAPVTRQLRKLLRQSNGENARLLAEAMLAKAREDPSFARLLLDRVEGTVEQAHRHTGASGPAVVIEVVDAKAPQRDGETSA